MHLFFFGCLEDALIVFWKNTKNRCSISHSGFLRFFRPFSPSRGRDPIGYSMVLKQDETGSGNKPCLEEQTGPRPNWQACHHPKSHHDGPEAEKAHGIRQHHGSEGPKSGIFFIFIHEDDNHGKIGHEGSNDIGGRVPNAVGNLCQGRGKTEPIHHGNEDGGHDGPFCRCRPHKEVKEGGQENEENNEWGAL